MCVIQTANLYHKYQSYKNWKVLLILQHVDIVVCGLDRKIFYIFAFGLKSIKDLYENVSMYVN